MSGMSGLTVPAHDVTIGGILTRSRGDSTAKRWRIVVAMKLGNGAKARKQLTAKSKTDATQLHEELTQAKRAGARFSVATGRSVDVSAGGDTVLEVALRLCDEARTNLAPNGIRSTVTRTSWVVAALGPLPDGVTMAQATDVLTPYLKGDELTGRRLDLLRRIQQVSRPMASVTTRDAEAVIAKARTNLNGKPAAGKTPANRRTALATLMGFAADSEVGALAVNPMDNVRRASRNVSKAQRTKAVQPVRRERIGTVEQVEALLAALQDVDSTVYGMARCVWITGCRPEEAAGAKGTDVENEGGLIRFARSAPYVPAGYRKNLRHGEVVLPGGRVTQPLKHQSFDHTRPVGIPARYRPWLSAEAQAAGSGFIWGADLDGDRPSEAWRKAREQVAARLGLHPDALRELYDLRHTWASLALNKGVSDVKVANQLGHSVAVLRQVYAHVIRDDDGVIDPTA